MLVTSGSVVKPVRRSGMFILTLKKKCSKCGETKPFKEFAKAKNKLGVSSWCLDCGKEYSHQNRLAHPEKIAKYHEKYKRNNPEKIKESQGVYQKTHLEKSREKCRRYYASHKEKFVDKQRNWLKNNPDYSRLHVQKYKSAKKGNGGKITDQEWADLCDKYGNKCLRCGKSNVKLTIDHVVPISLGGKNVIENVQPLCLSCNSSKHTKVIDYR
jgi:5-methylcytosine-specific restriction endonuclease McrA